MTIGTGKVAALGGRGIEREALWWALGAFVVLSLAFHQGIAHMVTMWMTEEYSHAWIIPPLAALIALERLRDFTPRPRDGRWMGLPLLAGAFGLLAIGTLSGIYSIINYGYLLGIGALVWAGLGASGAWRLRGPLAYLIFMLPLPKALYIALSAKMQLWSSELGVGLIRMLGVSVFLDGNIIDLGSYQLEVAEACNGLRYMFPLISFGFLAAMLLRDAWWKRVVLVLSTLPITVLMNSVRVAMIGVLVDRYGIEMAQGAQHFVEGFVIFGVCIALLLLEVYVLLRLPPRGGTFQALSILQPGRDQLRALGRGRAPRLFRVAAGLVVLGAAAVLPLSMTQAEIPDRTPLRYFPLQLGAWRGVPDPLDAVYLDVLQATDTTHIDYTRAGGMAGVNLLISYYDSQRYGVAVHSPQECIPGGGWVIRDFDTRTIPTEVAGTAATGGVTPVSMVARDASADAAVPSRPETLPPRVNRAVITRQGITQVVYYWFEQRGRQLTNEYMVKARILTDALTRGRTDGAMVRLISPVLPGEDEADADARLLDFLGQVHDDLPAFIPY